MVLALKYLLFSKIFWPGWTLSNCEDQPRVAKVQTMAYGGLFGWSLCKTNVTSKPIITRIFIKWIEWKVKENTCEVNYRKHKKTRATRFPWWILVCIWLVDSTMLVFFTNYRWVELKLMQSIITFHIQLRVSLYLTIVILSFLSSNWKTSSLTAT